MAYGVEAWIIISRSQSLKHSTKYAFENIRWEDRPTNVSMLEETTIDHIATTIIKAAGNLIYNQVMSINRLYT